MIQITELPAVHIVHNYLINPTNPITLNLIGAGGTGSQVLSTLARINQALLALDHPGLQVNLFDSDCVTEANLGRQLFSHAELGMNKAVALIHRFNRFYSMKWKAFDYNYSKANLYRMEKAKAANITITCVDSPAARFEIANMLLQVNRQQDVTKVNQPLYWMDFGNTRYTGQVLLSTIGKIKQPQSQKFQPVDNLPFVTTLFKELLQQASADDGPSCSLAEALTKQDLFINSSLANIGSSLLWQMFTEGMLFNKGFFLNIKEFISNPIPIDYAPANNGSDSGMNTAIAA